MLESGRKGSLLGHLHSGHWLDCLIYPFPKYVSTSLELCAKCYGWPRNEKDERLLSRG